MQDKYSHNKKLFAATIQKLINDKGMTKGEFAKSINVAAPTVSKYLSAITLPDTDVLIRISELYGISIDFLLLGIVRKPELLPEYIDTAGILLRDDIVKYITRVPEDEYITLDDNGMAEITENKAAMHSQSLEEIADSICLHEIILDLKELQARYRKMVEKMFSESEKGEE